MSERERGRERECVCACVHVCVCEREDERVSETALTDLEIEGMEPLEEAEKHK